MKEERSELANKIKEYRKLRNMTAQDLSEKSGINLSTIKKYETDGRNPKLEQLQKIADALEVSIFEFLDIEIKSVSDILSLLNKMNESTSMNWMIDDETGTANISFNINEINKSLCDYTLFNNNESLIIEENKNQYSSFIKKLIMNNGKIK
ncbi:MAG: helix-turn-helix transcriptional regulator [Eubacteriales bacterium]|nr:helix-turn-helix transcriptional regulator [Eubacteriales bacterium]